MFVLSPAGLPRPPTANRSAASAIGNRIRFTGREFDEESGLYWYRTRYYDARAGRFTSRDSIGVWGDGNNLGNGSAYVGNNPWSFVDPWGLDAQGDGPERDRYHYLDRRIAELFRNGPPATDEEPGGEDYPGFWADFGASVARDLFSFKGVAAVLEGWSWIPMVSTGADAANAVLHLLRGDPATAAIFALGGLLHGARKHLAGAWRRLAGMLGSAGRRIADAARWSWHKLFGAGGGIGNGARDRIPTTGGVIRQFEQPAAQTYYRVFSGDATAGKWLTAVPPRSSAYAQEALALPPGNRATMLQEVRVPAGTMLERSRAIPVPEWNSGTFTYLIMSRLGRVGQAHPTPTAFGGLEVLSSEERSDRGQGGAAGDAAVPRGLREKKKK